MFPGGFALAGVFVRRHVNSEFGPASASLLTAL
jgi:hypothetical protein